MSECMRSIVERLHYRSNNATLLEATGYVDEYFKGNDGRNYRVLSRDDEGEVSLSMVLGEPYDYTKYCTAKQIMIDSDEEYDPDLPEDDQTVWEILDPEGEILHTMPGSSSWVSVADSIHEFDVELGFIEE